MLKHHLLVALRQVAGQRLHTLINVAGLSVGLACFILIGLFVAHEWSYDRQWAQSERIYRLSRDFYGTAQSTEARLAGMPGTAAPLLAETFPEIEKAARIFCCGGVAKAPDGEAFMERGYAMADPELFAIFDFEWLRGEPSTALGGPYDVVLTASAARRHFGERDPVGETLLLGGGAGEWESLRVTGVIADLPENTALDFDMLQSMAAWSVDAGSQRYLNDWGNNVFHTFALLREGADIADVQRRSGELFERHFEAGSSAYTGFTAMPIASIHLRSDREGEMQGSGESKTAGSVAVVYTFAAIAVFVLLLACINFTNLATARSAQRAREIGVRKALGAARAKVVGQFLMESTVVAAVAVVIAVALVELALPSFNAFLGFTLAFDYRGDPAVVAGLLALAVVTGLVAGSYPAFFLSAFEPARVLKGDFTRGAATGRFRKALVVLQFSISIGLLIATFVTYRQMQFAHGIELGFEKEQVVVIGPNNVGGEQWETLKREWLAHPGVRQVTRADVVPFAPNGRTAEVRTDGGTAERMEFVRVDYDFFETFAIGVSAGRTFSAAYGDRPTDEDDPVALANVRFVVNELGARGLGLEPGEAVGQRVSFGSFQGTRFRTNEASGEIVGVVPDVHYESLRSAIAPTIYVITGDGDAALRISGRDVPGTLAHIDEKWKQARPDLPASRRFLDQSYDALYRAEERQQQVFTFFALVAVVIACLGVLGLASFATERRTKEIGIRKVMGGTVVDIVRLFGAEFGKLALLANVVAWPIAYVLMRRWLEGFAYRIELGPLVFVAAAALVLTITLLTVGTVAARAAWVKPITSLRCE
jgi:putative ABC transport system permease protein